VLALCSVGSLKHAIGVGSFMVCSDYWCPWDLRRVYADARGHFMPGLCEPLRAAVLDIVRHALPAGHHVQPSGVYANARGPRFETKAEIRLMESYCDVVGMTAAHEASGCSEVGLPYAMLAMVDNYAHGIGEALSLELFHASQAANLAHLELCLSALVQGLPRAPALQPAAAGSSAMGEGASTGAGAGAAAAAAKPPAGGAGAVPAAPAAVTTPCDLMVHARWLVAMAEGRESEVLEHHALVCTGGLIVAILPSATARALYAPSRTSTLSARHVLMPGLVNAHTHLSMNLMKGLSDDKALMSWLTEDIWPTEGRLVCEEFVAAGARAAIAELIRGGVTTFNDMYFFPHAVASAAEAAGVRAVVGSPILEFPSKYAGAAGEYISKGVAERAAWREARRAGAVSARVTYSVAPHAPYTVSDATFAKAHEVATAEGLPVHVHLHETAGEVQASASGGAAGPASAKHMSDSLTSPLLNLARLGLVNERLVAVHMTCLSAEEIALLGAARSSVVHCPTSNLKLASGFCPVAKLLAGGVNVALGTDGASSNNSLDMFAEMKLAATLAKGVAGDATAVPAWQALRMATRNGAAAVGLGGVAGSLEVGKAADAVAVDLGEVESLPMYSVLSHLVYATGRGAVTDVWVDGAPLLVDRRLTTLNEAALRVELAAWAAKVKPATASATAVGGQ
jgi:5-methylthioadenosine/S-adenosylhomocysteine deaminase